MASNFAGNSLVAEELALRLTIGLLAELVPGFADQFKTGMETLKARNPTPAVGEALAELAAIADR